mgnify:CR=1 FL=1
METNTALPWHVVAIDSKARRIVGDETEPQGTWDKLQINGPNATVATVYRTKDVRAICTAVNAHEELLRALKATLPALERLGDFVGNVDTGGASGLGIIDRCAIIRQVRAAIARATGQEVTP